MQIQRTRTEKILDAVCLVMIPAMLILLFVYTGVSKLIEHSLFLHQLAKVPLLQNFAGPISYTVPAVEIVLVFLLFRDTTRITGLVCSVILMAAFTAYVAIIISGAHVPCSCGGVISKMSWSEHLIFNIALVLLAGISLYYHKSLHVYKGVS